MSGLAGKAAIVTGATSGIGRATALALAKAGARVLAVGRDETRAAECVAAIEAIGGEAAPCLGDLTDPAFCDAAVAACLDRYARLDVVANVAGVIRRGDAPATSDDDWRIVMAANVDAVFFLSRAAVRAMRGAGGAIVNLGSTVGLVGCAGMPAYCASKGAVVQLTRAMALDHAAEGIRVNAVCPGAVDTPMLISEHADPSATPEAVHARNLASIPQGRIPAPEEIAELVVFLAGDAGRHITGAAIPIDGGYTAQ